ncbi:MAG: pyridoxamine 5'-phosphate oxidase family protein [Sedimentisphaerales bacterium]|nr:pyridoxamine 5'-phosphate oxidase family protein [Sedimentisphaerales bacterium]
MDLAAYFENTKGTGILATTDLEGNVDAAIYARPYVIDEKTIAFSMLERLSFANIQVNPKAAYLFIERGEGYSGKRLYLKKTHEETDPEHIKELKKKHSRIFNPDQVNRHIVYFQVEKIRALVGDKEEAD